jgi:hypothetical protein
MTQNIVNRFYEIIDPMSEKAVFMGAIISLLMVAVIDWATGLDIQFYMFYIIPIAITGMKCRPVITYVVAILCFFSWLFTDWLSGYQYTYLPVEIWNNMIRASIFFILGFATINLKELLGKERELSRNLAKSLLEIRQLKELLPICSYCKKIRDDEGHWQYLEGYISERVDTKFSHGVCPECLEKVMKEIAT